MNCTGNKGAISDRNPPFGGYGSPMDHIEWLSEPEMSNPILVIAFEGWNDAGDAATTAANYIARRWDADEFATLDPEPFYDFSSNRPMVRLDEHHVRRLEWPANSFSHLRLDDGRDVVVLTGVEPRLRWRTFCEQITGIATRVDASLVITLGALLAEVHHANPIEVVGSSSDPALAESLGLHPSRYEGPTGIVGVLHQALGQMSTPTMSLWASVPTYVPSSTSPKAALALVERLANVLAVPLAATDLHIASSSYERQIDDLLSDDEELAEYAAQILLDALDDEPEEDSSEQSDAEVDPEALIEELEQYLRDNG